jgi:hypothetical protein
MAQRRQGALSRDRERNLRRRMFGDTPPVGLQFTLSDKVPRQIVDMVQDGKYDSLTETPWAAMFFPLEQRPDTDTSLVLRSSLSPGELVPEISRRLAQIDPSLPFIFHSWPGALDFVLFPARAATASLGVMGLLAAMLAITGVFGMAMCAVSKRIKEFAIRVALGAQPPQLMRSALSRPVVLLFLGSVAGFCSASWPASGWRRSCMRPRHATRSCLPKFVITMAVLGIVATWIPAQRALRIHPARRLREE